MLNSIEQICLDAILTTKDRSIAAGQFQPSRTVLITGGTGFLGRYVVAHLLQDTELNLIILARGKSGLSADKRVSKVLSDIGINIEEYPVRIKVMEGDVTQEYFGLDPFLYEAIAKDVSTVYHCAAAVDWVRDYGRLRRTNVDGVRRVIGFASAERTKRIVFSSSIAVCMWNNSPNDVFEDTPVLPHVSGMPLGYARSKAVAETLLSQAAELGIPVTIVRPPLISGHSRTGHSNSSDILAAFLQACIRTGKGPETDWAFDIAPVDYVARVFTDVPQGNENWQVINIKQEKTRTWINVLTWINLHGYEVEPVSTDAWIHHLFDNAEARGLMLYTQRQYFAGRNARAGETGWIRPFETYLADRYAKVSSSKTNKLLNELGIKKPEISVDLLHVYFDNLRHSKVLPERKNGGDSSALTSSPPSVISSLLQVKEPNAPGVTSPTARPVVSNTGVMHQLAASLSPDIAGLWVLENNDASMGNDENFDSKVLKILPRGSVLRDQSAVLASVSSDRLGKLFRRFGDPFDLNDSHERELAVYQTAPSRFAHFMPKAYELKGQEGPDHFSLLMEYVPEAETNDSSNWVTSKDADAKYVIEGMASLHATWFGQTENLDKHIKPVSTPSIDRILEMSPLWLELAAVSRSRIEYFGGEKMARLHLSILNTLTDWWPHYASLPRTLIHNDFNPRNFAIRSDCATPRMCLFDWEMAAIGPPQRDLAELLCFIWTAGATLTHLQEILDLSRRLLEAKSGHKIPHENWHRGFQFSLQYFLISRLPLYIMSEKFAPLEFLPAVISNWDELFSLSKQMETTAAPKSASDLS